MPISSIARLLLAVTVGGLGLATWHLFGPIAGARYVGVLWLAVALWASFSPSLEVYGNTKLCFRLLGWKKLGVTIPLATLSLGLLIYAPEITCSIARYAHLCT